MLNYLIFLISLILAKFDYSYNDNIDLLIKSIPVEMSEKQKNLENLKDIIDIFGYPLIENDTKNLIDALNENRFQFIDNYFNDLINRVKYDYRFERVLTVSLSSFVCSKDFNTDKVKIWIKNNPQSSVPYMIIGEYCSIYARKARGEDTYKNTPVDSLTKMRKLIGQSNRYLKKGLKYDDENIAIYCSLISNNTILGSLKKRVKYLYTALKVNPGLYFIRVNNMRGLAPRWGGSYYLMDLLAQNSERLSEINPRMNLVRGMIANDKALDLQLGGEYSKAEELLKQHTNNDKNYYNLYDLGLCQARQLKYRDAIKSYEKAIKLQPDRSKYYRENASANLMVAVGEKANNKRFYLNNFLILIEKAAKISPDDIEIGKIQKRYLHLGQHLISNDSLKIKMFGYWYLIEENPVGAEQRTFTVKNTPQINQYEFDILYNNIPQGSKKVNMKEDTDSTFYANSGGNSPFKYKYYISFKSDTMLLAEINPKGGYYWKDKYLPYNEVFPPKHWNKKS